MFSGSRYQDSRSQSPKRCQALLRTNVEYSLWENAVVARDIVGNETKFLLSGYLHATSGEIRQGQISKKGHNIILGSDNFH